tara:strand:- start:1 stop:174 length:174 start_codon:yes stop_codon:yes gene_type:complete
VEIQFEGSILIFPSLIPSGKYNSNWNNRKSEKIIIFGITVNWVREIIIVCEYFYVLT